MPEKVSHDPNCWWCQQPFKHECDTCGVKIRHDQNKRCAQHGGHA